MQPLASGHWLVSCSLWKGPDNENPLGVPHLNGAQISRSAGHPSIRSGSRCCSHYLWKVSFYFLVPTASFPQRSTIHTVLCPTTNCSLTWLSDTILSLLPFFLPLFMMLLRLNCFAILSVHLPTGAPSAIVRSSVELSYQLFCDLDLFSGAFLSLAEPNRTPRARTSQEAPIHFLFIRWLFTGRRIQCCLSHKSIATCSPIFNLLDVLTIFFSLW